MLLVELEVNKFLLKTTRFFSRLWTKFIPFYYKANNPTVIRQTVKTNERVSQNVVD